MARQRKAASKADNEIPLTSPSKMSSRAKPDKPLIDITEDEQWRLINPSGILQNPALVQESRIQSTVDVEDEEISLCDEIFNAVTLIIPFSSLLLLMEMYVSTSCPICNVSDIFYIKPYPPPIRQNGVFRNSHGQNATWCPKLVQLS